MRFFGKTCVRCMFLVLAALVIFNVYLTVNPPEPEVCALCGSMNGVYYAPVLVNLFTGELDEMAVYQRDIYNRDHLASEQRTGFLRLGKCAGAEYCLEGGEFCRVSVPPGNRPMVKARYCHDCRKLLSSVRHDGYALVDAHDLDDKKVYEIREGAEYDINGYTTTVFYCGDTQSLAVQVSGSLRDSSEKITENSKKAVAFPMYIGYTEP